jgi:O-acetyl-ADP-ribose deacetylase (regulator of RNase III)
MYSALMATIEVIEGDITRMQLDAIVNAANEALLAGSGVCGAIHRAAGDRLQEECRTVAPCPTGEARITQAYNLPAKFVIHTVGPVWQGGEHGEDELLASCYRHSLSLAIRHDVKSIAFPAISTGIFGFPMDRAATIAADETERFLRSEGKPEKVYFVCFDRRTYESYSNAVRALEER